MVESIYSIFLLYHVTSRDVRTAEAIRDPQNISDPRKDCGSFVNESCGRYIIGSILNK